MNTRATGREYLTNLIAAVSYPFETWRRTIGAVAVTGATYVLLILSTMPAFSLQMLGDGLHWFEYVVVSLTETVYRTDGWTGLGIIVLYALLSGIAVVNAVTQLRLVGVSSLADLSGIVPGLLASGCASCGAGLLGFLGFAGGLAALPYDGALVRVGGLVLLLFFLGRAGHPERCTIATEGAK
ncbi:hypothetical protein C488_00577 [Natrinema pellirubrum DSM 15624]|uniref:Uncharacterized protein n=1 Tax=Natrinema pellirubrum (strain DSM 15624 / CIP 106293 / JCM 10476 / NCIMB 786 / 157) TaxID=797303 RepID=L0JLZ2_NATP1|nr:hypothetical protein [Natrinema pellirubrum]AGB31376.1 hypothetical protein Natpe_1474 [Natrinema pellirubrum DSM 15624]ELY82072.1 hypothetical protein C488_00577 [Natrinema pellirubrum DSM 15624]